MHAERRDGDTFSSIGSTVEIFKLLATPAAESGEMDRVKEIFARLYAQLRQKITGHSAEEQLAKQEMEKALQEILSRPLKDRHRYFSKPQTVWRRSGRNH